MDNVQCLRTSGARGLEQAIEALSYFLRAKPWSPFLVCQGVTHREPGRDLHASVAPYGKESRGLHLHAEDPFRLVMAGLLHRLAIRCVNGPGGPLYVTQAHVIQ